MQVTFVELGDVPPNGDPNGDSAPPRPSEAEAIEAKEEPNTPNDKPVVEEAEPVSEVPSETPATEQPVVGSPPQLSNASFSELTGTVTQIRREPVCTPVTNTNTVRRFMVNNTTTYPTYNHT